MSKYRLITGLFIAISLGIDSCAQAPVFAPEARRIMSRVRQNQATAETLRFEHRISIEETEGKGLSVKLADVSFITANRISPGKPGGMSPSSFCAERCRLESRIGGKLRSLLVRDGTTTWLYNSQSGAYMKGSTLRDVFPAAPMATFLATHAVSLDDLREEAWSELRQLKDDFVVIDGERRATYLVEATLKNNGISMDALAGRLPDVENSFLSTPSNLLQMFSMQGLTNQRNPFAYFAAPGAPPAKVRYWIDKQRYLVLRRTGIQTAAKIVATAQRSTPPNSPSAIPNSEVVLRTEDLFSRVDLGAAVPESVFTFRAPDGAREIPNLRQPAPTPPDGARQVLRTADVWAYYRVLPDSLNLTVEVPQGWSAAITVDVDQDGKRAQPDVEYGKTGDLICSSRVLDATRVSSCGGFESKALLRLQRTGQREVLNFVLPRRELSADGKSVRFNLRIWNAFQSSWQRFGTALFPHEVIFPTN